MKASLPWALAALIGASPAETLHCPGTELDGGRFDLRLTIDSAAGTAVVARDSATGACMFCGIFAIAAGDGIATWSNGESGRDRVRFTFHRRDRSLTVNRMNEWAWRLQHGLVQPGQTADNFLTHARCTME